MNSWRLKNEIGDSILVRIESDSNMLLSVKDEVLNIRSSIEITPAEARELITMLTAAIAEAEKQKNNELRKP